MDPMSNISTITAAPSDPLATLATQEDLYQMYVTSLHNVRLSYIMNDLILA